MSDTKTFLWPRQLKRASAIAFFAAAFAVVGAGTGWTAGNTDNAQASATATVIEPLTLTNTGPLNFGQIVPTGVAGTVTISSGPIPSRSSSNVDLLGTAFSQASFVASGEPGLGVDIGLPGTIPVDSGANTMSVDLFSSLPSGVGTLDNPGGFLVFVVGATLFVGATQAAGNYAGTFDVTVTYQ